MESAIVTGPLHDDEIRIDLALVRGLVDRTRPALASLPLRPFGRSGSSNALFRLGDELLVRLPRQPGESATISKEARWLPEVGPHLPVAVPEIVLVGEPGLGYPERWSIVRWLPGELPPIVNSTTPPDPNRGHLAQDLADLIAALRRVEVSDDALRDPTLRWYRGEPLAALDAGTRGAIADCRGISGLHLDLDAVLRTWDEAMDLPGVDHVVSPHWFHGDLLAENLLVRDARLSALLDFGGLAVGDPTVDLIPAWEVLDVPARNVFRRALDVDEATWLRGRAWALSLAVMTFPYYWRTMPARCRSRLAVAHAVLAEAAGAATS